MGWNPPQLSPQLSWSLTVCVHLKQTTLFAIHCAQKTLNVAALNIPDTQMYKQKRVVLCLLDNDKPACKGTSKRDPLHAHLQHASESAKRNLP